MRSAPRRDVAVVLSGGGMNAVLMELGFLKRLRESELWPRIAVFIGTSAGALVGAMSPLDRLDELEAFLYRLRPEETFRANRLWQLPLLGTHDYVLPQSIEERLGDLTATTYLLQRSKSRGPPPFPETVTSVTMTRSSADAREMAQAVLASAAISVLVLPQLVGDRVATDGGWVRNYPLGCAWPAWPSSVTRRSRSWPRSGGSSQSASSGRSASTSSRDWRRKGTGISR